MGGSTLYLAEVLDLISTERGGLGRFGGTLRRSSWRSRRCTWRRVRRVPEAGLLGITRSTGLQRMRPDAYQPVLRDHGIVCSMQSEGQVLGPPPLNEELLRDASTPSSFTRRPWLRLRIADDNHAVNEVHRRRLQSLPAAHARLGYVSRNNCERRHVLQAQRAGIIGAVNFSQARSDDPCRQPAARTSFTRTAPLNEGRSVNPGDTPSR